MSQAVHPMYALRWLLGDVAQVACLFGDRKVVDMTAEDTAVVLLKFKRGIAAEMTCTFGIAHGPLDHSITFHGRDGYLNMSQRRLWAISPRLFGDRELHEVELPMTDLSATAFGRMWEDYARGILDGAPTRVVGEDGKRAVEIIEAAYRSNASGRAIDLPLEG
jgi:predicted dehydrogenase